MKQTNKLQVKDLVTIGIFSVIYSNSRSTAMARTRGERRPDTGDA